MLCEVAYHDQPCFGGSPTPTPGPPSRVRPGSPVMDRIRVAAWLTPAQVADLRDFMFVLRLIRMVLGGMLEVRHSPHSPN